MKVIINGDLREIASARTIRELMDELRLPARALFVEHNGVALRTEEWDAALRDGDRIEIVRIVAGG